MLVTLIVLMLVVGGVVVWGIVQFNSIDRVKVKLAAAAAGKPQNFLIVGSDTRDLAHTGGSDAGGIFGNSSDKAPSGKRADTMVVARIDPGKATMEILSIPRDLWVKVPGSSTQHERINASYNAGPQAVIDAIHENLGLDINHYIEVDFNGFKGLVEAVDGVPMYFDRAVYDRNTGLDIKKKGCITLNGVQALEFARSRHLVYSTGSKWESDPTGDLGRITRQQVFLRHALAKTTSLGLTDFNTVRKLVDVAVDSVHIDDTLSKNDILSLARRFSKFDAKNLVTHRLPAVPDTTGGGADILRLDDAAARDVLDVFTGRKASSAVGSGSNGDAANTPAAPLPNTITVDVLNGSTKAGLAKKVGEQVAGGGFVVGTVGNGTPATETTIRYGSAAKAAATVLASKVTPTPKLTEDPTLAANAVQLTVVDESLTVAKGSASTTTAPGGAGVPADQASIGMQLGDPPPGIKCG